MKLKKGSAKAKAWGRRMRALRGKKNRSFKTKTRATKQRVRKRKTKSKVRPMAKKRRRGRFVKRTRRRSRRGGKLGSLMSRETLLLGVGAGASGMLGAYVTKYAPQIPNNYAEAAAAAALVMFGSKIHPALRTIGKGVMIKVIGDFVETNVMPKVLGGGNPSGASGDF